MSNTPLADQCEKIKDDQLAAMKKVMEADSLNLTKAIEVIANGTAQNMDVMVQVVRRLEERLNSLEPGTIGRIPPM